MNSDLMPVTVLGLGSMGRALAEAYIDAGHPTTVWNRTAAKAAPLAAKGAAHAASIEDAVAASPLLITCLTTFGATVEALEPAAAALKGRTLVTLNSGVPSDAVQAAEWAARHGARFLGGAIKNVPDAVGAPDTLLYYGGPKEVFDEHKETLKVMGGDTVHLGESPDLAALYESAVGATLLPALVAFLQGAAVVADRGLPAATLVPYTVKWLQMIAEVLPGLAAEIDGGDYTGATQSVGLFRDAAADDRRVLQEAGVDHTSLAPLHALLERAVTEGHRDHSIASLFEVLRKPA
ncbi:NAD(P)-dependent oxidoreductase [Actinomadura sp. 21ATH]|uniref:NAD(P)-dependent oxidoreductase n=1 Tax=Actinomadura sp. 21ATH TaxID=1735444 RepID=UPI0035BF487C